MFCPVECLARLDTRWYRRAIGWQKAAMAGRAQAQVTIAYGDATAWRQALLQQLPVLSSVMDQRLRSLRANADGSDHRGPWRLSASPSHVDQ